MKWIEGRFSFAGALIAAEQTSAAQHFCTSRQSCNARMAPGASLVLRKVCFGAQRTTWFVVAVVVVVV